MTVWLVLVFLSLGPDGPEGVMLTVAAADLAECARLADVARQDGAIAACLTKTEGRGA